MSDSIKIKGKESQGSDLKRSKIIRKKKIRAFVFTTIFAVVYSFCIWQACFGVQFEQYREDMMGNISASEHEYSHIIAKNDLYIISNEDVMRDVTGYGAHQFEEHGGYSKRNLKIIQGDFAQIATTFYFSGYVDEENQTVVGELHKSLDKKSLVKDYNIKLMKKDLYKLFTEGAILKNGIHLTAAPISDEGYIINIWAVSDVLKEQNMLSGSASNINDVIVMYNVETMTIEDATDTSLIGESMNTVVDSSTLAGSTPGVLYKYGSGTHKKYFVIGEENDGVVFCAYTMDMAFKIELLIRILLPALLGCAFIFIIASYVTRYYIDHMDKEEDESEYIMLIGKRYVNRKFLSHIIAVLVFACILVIVPTIYIRTLINYGHQNMSADSYLERVESVIAMNHDNDKIMEEDFYGNEEILLNFIANYYLRYPDSLDENELYDLASKMPNVVGITIFDKTGTVEYDSKYAGENNDVTFGTDIGYTLSRDDSVSEHECWDILNGNKKIVHYQNNNNLYVAVERQDKPGIIRIQLTGTVLEQFAELTKPERVMEETYFTNSYKIFINSNDLGHMKIMTPSSSGVNTEMNNLTEAEMTDGYSGVGRISGYKCYINTRNIDSSDYILLVARPAIELNGMHNAKVLLVIIISFIIFGFGVVFSISKKLVVDSDRKFDLARELRKMQTTDEKWMNDRFRKISQEMVIAASAAVVLLMIIDKVVAKSSLVNYLFTDQWAKGLNLFSLTMIFIVVAVAIVGGSILGRSIDYFTKNMGPRGVTIGGLLSSILRFLILLIVLIMVLMYIGIDLGTLLAGAGIAGALISFTAQQTVNDFLSEVTVLHSISQSLLVTSPLENVVAPLLATRLPLTSLATLSSCLRE